MELAPYLMFNGDCRAAIEFYRDCLNGEIQGLSTFGEAHMPEEMGEKDRVMHVTLTFNNGMFMASDSMASNAVNVGDNVHMSLNFHDIAQMEEVFNKLSEGGEITMPLQDTFWGARFGMVRDKFKVNWMFNTQLQQEGGENK
jgi:PhnB protein